MIIFEEINILDMSSCKKVFKLRQNTPIWHFQHDQTDATLRASEVKPKLDKYIIANCNSEIEASWYVNEDKTALDYKLRIYSECEHAKMDKLPMFFANLGSSKKPECLAVSDKKALSGKEICLEIFCLHDNLMKLIEDKLDEFFIVHNFGTRQSKGFGSFSLVQDGGITIPELDKEYVLESGIALKFKSFFKVESLKRSAPFNEIEVFSKSIRSGINDCRMLCFNSDDGCKKKELDAKLNVWMCGMKGSVRCIYRRNCSVFYMKSMLFKFLDDNRIKWDKKLLKLAFDPMKEDRDNGEIIVLWRDMLGLAERTKLYNGDLEKKGNVDIKRFKSPIFIKPVKFFDENGEKFYKVYVGFVNTIEKYEVAGRSIEVVLKTRGRNYEGRSAEMANLDLERYLHYVVNNGCGILKGLMSSKPHTFREVTQTADYTKHEFYSMLERIYSELKSNMNEKS